MRGSDLHPVEYQLIAHAVVQEGSQRQRWHFCGHSQLLGQCSSKDMLLIHNAVVPEWVLIICFDLSSSLIFKNFKDHRNKMFLFHWICKSQSGRESVPPSVQLTGQMADEVISIRL